MIKIKKFIFTFLLIFFLFFIYIITFMKSYSSIEFANISNNFFRLHIIANSDSTKDQLIKYSIRDNILKYMSQFLNEASSKNEVKQIVKNHISEITNIAEKTLKEYNYNDSVNISIAKSHFPTKQYDGFTLPEGNYDALNVTIGDGNGQNWWCVMYPSICVFDSSDFQFNNNTQNILENILNPEEYNLLCNTTTNKNFQIKFKLLELFENI